MLFTARRVTNFGFCMQKAAAWPFFAIISSHKSDWFDILQNLHYSRYLAEQTAIIYISLVMPTLTSDFLLVI